MKSRLQNTLMRDAVRGFLVGALWGSAAAVLEASLLNRWFHSQLQMTLATLEIAINYAVYAGAGAMVVTLIVAASPWHRLRLVEPAVASIVVVGVLAAFVQMGPLAPLPPISARGMLLGAGVLAIMTVLALGIGRLSPRLRASLHGALVVWIAAGVVWHPLTEELSGRRRGAGEKLAAGARMNVLLIVTDTLRRDYLDCYGADWGASPAANRLAASGTLFDNQVVQSTWTLPSTASILTGRFPSSHGATGHGRSVSPTATTIAEVFQGAGYRTGAFTENLHVLPRNGFGQGFDDFWAVWIPWTFGDALLYRVGSRLKLPTIELTEKRAFPWPVTDPTQVNWDARRTTDHALSWLEEGGRTPFFAYVHYMGPHGPYGPPEYLLDRPAPSVTVTDHPRPMGEAYPLGEAGAEVSPQALDDMRTLYAADIRYVEGEIIRLLDWLRDSGRIEHTLVVFTSDHGEEFFDHGAWNHGSTAFDEVLRAPLIMSLPGLVPAGKHVTDVTRHIDIMPTILDLAGMAIPERVQGRSLRPLLDGHQLEPLAAYTEVYPVRPPDCSIVSLVRDVHKIVRVRVGSESAVLLYDLAADPMERTDLSRAEPQLVRSLLEDLDVWDQAARRYSPDSDTVPMDSRTLELLKSLGYVN